MSTRGSFIIRKGYIDKSLYIHADAYPSGAGDDILRIIKSLDLHKLYNMLIPGDEIWNNSDKDIQDDSYDFSLERCIETVKKEKEYIYGVLGKDFILDSLVCEYAYVINLDQNVLEFYVGFQQEPQDGNRYGTESKRDYYPCALKATFSFDFISQNQSSDIIDLMETAADEHTNKIHQYEASHTLNITPKLNAEQPCNIRQLIIARKDLQMSPGKLAAQVSHASMAFITDRLKKSGVDEELSLDSCNVAAYHISISLEPEIYNQWLHGIFTKIICEARNKNHLLKAVTIAQELGLQENKDFYLIRDKCLTELTPEEIDENGIGQTLTCIGFKPMDDKIVHKISKKYQLYK